LCTGAGGSNSWLVPSPESTMKGKLCCTYSGGYASIAVGLLLGHGGVGGGGLSTISYGPSNGASPPVEMCVVGERVRWKRTCLLEVAVVARAEVVGDRWLLCHTRSASAFRE
jgi:hypothetical protein